MVLYLRRGEPSTGGYEIVDPKTNNTIGSLSWSQFRDAQNPNKPEYQGEIIFLPPRDAVKESISKREEVAQRKEMGYKSPSQTYSKYIKEKGTEAKVPSMFVAKKYETELQAQQKEIKQPMLSQQFAASLAYQQALNQAQRPQVKRYEVLGQIPSKETILVPVDYGDYKPPVQIKTAEQSLFERGIYQPQESTTLFKKAKLKTQKYLSARPKVKAAVKGAIYAPKEISKFASKQIIKPVATTATKILKKSEKGYEFGIKALETKGTVRSKILAKQLKIPKFAVSAGVGLLGETAKAPTRTFWTFQAGGLISGMGAAKATTQSLIKRTAKKGVGLGIQTLYGSYVATKTAMQPNLKAAGRTLGKEVQPLAAFAVGYNIPRISKSIALSSKIKSKSKDIAIREIEKTTLPQRDVRVGVRYLEGTKDVTYYTKKGATLKSVPVLSKKQYITPDELTQPKIMMGESYSTKLGRLPQPKKGKQIVKPFGDILEKGAKKKYLFTSKDLSQLSQPRVSKLDMSLPIKGKQIRFRKTYLRPFDYSKSKAVVTTPKPEYAKPPPESYTKIGGRSIKPVGYTGKLGFTGYYGRISESGLPIASEFYKDGRLIPSKTIKFTYDSRTLAASRAASKAMSSKRVASAAAKDITRPTSGGAIIKSRTGQVSVQKYKVIQDVKVKLKSPKQQQVYTMVSASKSKQAKKTKTKLKSAQRQKTRQLYKVSSSPVSPSIPTIAQASNQFPKLALALGIRSASKSRLSSALGSLSKQKQSQSLTVSQAQPQAQLQLQSQAQLQAQSISQLQAQGRGRVTSRAVSSFISPPKISKQVVKPTKDPLITIPKTSSLPKETEIELGLKPKSSRKKKRKGTYKPSIYGIDIFKKTGATIKKAPRFSEGLGIRLPTKAQASRKINTRF